MSSDIGDDELHALADGRLGRDRARAVEIEAACDPERAARLAAIRRQNELLRDIRRGLSRRSDPHFASALQSELARVAAGPSHREMRLRRAVSLAASIGILTLLVGAAHDGLVQPRQWAVAARSLLMQSSPAEVASIVAVAPEAAATPADGKSAILAGAGLLDGTAVLAWLRLHGAGEGTALRDLERAGLRPLGGRELTAAGRSAVQIVLEDESGRKLALYAGDVDAGGPAGLAVVPAGGLALHWRSGTLLMVLVGEATTPDLHELVGRVAASFAMRRVLPSSPREAGAEALQTAVVPGAPPAVGPAPIERLPEQVPVGSPSEPKSL